MAAEKRSAGGKRAAEGGSKEKQPLSPRERLLRGTSHPLRFHLLTLFNDREWSPTELADAVAEGLSQVSYHVKVLHDFELVELTRTEPRRGAVEHFYRATERSVIPMEIVEKMPQSGRQIVITDALEEITADVNDSIATGLFAARADSHIVRMPMILDEKGCEDGHVLGDGYIADMLKVVGESAKRLAESEDPQAMGVTAVLMVFRSNHAERDKKQPPGQS
jgi:predicted transcriptional regulator